MSMMSVHVVDLNDGSELRARIQPHDMLLLVNGLVQTSILGQTYKSQGKGCSTVDRRSSLVVLLD